jgi:ABC-2 type transport system permease protein
VVWGADMVAGEKERGTLRLVFSNPVGRKAWLFTKLLAHALVLLGVLGAALVLSLTVAWLSVGLPMGEGAWWRWAGWTLASVAYLLAWFGLGVACSTAASRVGPAAMASLGLWVLLVVVLPRTVVAAAEAAWPPPPTAPAHMAIRVAEVELMQEQQELVAAAEARGELKGKSAIVQSEGTQEIRDRIDAKAKARRAEAEGPMQAWKLGMARRLEAWAYLSPAALYLRASTAFAGTDAARQLSFVEQAGAWRQATLTHLNGLEESGVTEFKDYERLSRFRLVEASPGQVWASTWGPLLALALLAAGLWAWSLGRFARYDLR